MVQAQVHINQLPNGDFELTACSYLSTTRANVGLMRGADRIKLDIANSSTMAVAEDFVRGMVKKFLEDPDKGQPMLTEFQGKILPVSQR